MYFHPLHFVFARKLQYLSNRQSTYVNSNDSSSAREDIVMPLQSPIEAVDGKTKISNILVKKNTDIIISIIGANLDKAIWGDDAEEWKPERWLEPLPESVAAARLPGVYSSMCVTSNILSRNADI